jgi:hypothetical protein
VLYRHLLILFYLLSGFLRLRWPDGRVIFYSHLKQFARPIFVNNNIFILVHSLKKLTQAFDWEYFTHTRTCLQTCVRGTVYFDRFSPAFFKRTFLGWNLFESVSKICLMSHHRGSQAVISFLLVEMRVSPSLFLIFLFFGGHADVHLQISGRSAKGTFKRTVNGVSVHGSRSDMYIWISLL